MLSKKRRGSRHENEYKNRFVEILDSYYTA